MKTMPFMMLGSLVFGCAEREGDEAGLPPASVADECADYRTEYPSGPYGFTVGSVMADLPGMVDGSGAAQSLMDVFGDRTKMALVIANAFET